MNVGHGSEAWEIFEDQLRDLEDAYWLPFHELTEQYLRDKQLPRDMSDEVRKAYRDGSRRRFASFRPGS